MPQKCETISYYSPTPYRDPRKRASNPQADWRFTTMHLKPYPKPKDKEVQDARQDGTQTLHVDQRGVFRTEWGVRQACSHMGPPGNGTANRCPLSVISTNTLFCTTNNGNTHPTRVSGDFSNPWVRKNKAPSSESSSLLLLSTSTGLENEASLRIYHGEDGEGSLDIWAVIKPGNTKEKIAIFTAQKCSHAGAGDSNTLPDREVITPDMRTVSMKNKGYWDGDWCMAKRRKRSENQDKPGSMESQTQKTEVRTSTMTSNENSDLHLGIAEEMVRAEGEEGGKTVSVVEMVAYLEQRASNQQAELKPLLRSSSTITLSKSGPLLQLAEQVSKGPHLLEAQEEEEEEEESIRVLDMVAKLESQCLSRQSLREGGDLSRNNSLLRRVGRVLLAGSEPCTVQDNRVDGTPEGLCSDVDLPRDPTDAHLTVKTGSSESFVNCTRERYSRSEADQETGTSAISETAKDSVPNLVSNCNEEPLPGMLFFAHPPTQALQEENCLSFSENRPMSENAELSCNSQDKEHAGRLPHKQALNSLSPSLSSRGETVNTLEPRCDDVGTEMGEVSGINKDHVPLRRLVSNEFLEARLKIQLLLEPQQYMSFLPHHIIVKIFSLLPTESLAALKCTCHYFRFIIENYGVRPADSRWVSDPRYKEDPCKQCKKCYKRGDVSLCRWHHKPYCQALPYGPGYWMCCRGAHKDTPGCNVGLHDNRWVPDFHSVNMPIYKKSRDSEEDV